ncbi:hypothetical protein Leryth_003533 [Lithospermum erythrorhizon]|nr:hypothetical protein Leryth_003533 [Lithospermum erythrorhizon]
MVTTYSNIGIISVFQTKLHRSGSNVHAAEVGRNEVCTMCEEFASDAVNYISNNKTQTDIIEMLHQSCSKMFSFKQEVCIKTSFQSLIFHLNCCALINFGS